MLTVRGASRVAGGSRSGERPAILGQEDGDTQEGCHQDDKAASKILEYP